MIVVIPIGGLGKRFKDAGYTFPKILVPVRNKPILQWAVESLGLPDAKHIFVCHEDDLKQWPIREMCEQLVPGSVVVAEEVRKGAASAVLHGLAHGELPDDELIIANSDQWLDWEVDHFLTAMRAEDVQGGIPVFRSVHPRWSYARINEKGQVAEVAEKRPISPWATCGVYYWQSSHQFVAAARAMIAKEIRTNGEYYVAPVYNELLGWGGTVGVYNRLTMYGLGTPEDLEEFRIAVCSGRIPG